MMKTVPQVVVVALVICVSAAAAVGEEKNRTWRDSSGKFEVEAKQLRDYMLEHYNRVAVVVRSALGEMQVQRYEDPAIRMLVFRSVERALDFLALHDRRAAG